VGKDAKEVWNAGKSQFLTFMFQHINENAEDLALYVISGSFSVAYTVCIRSDITLPNIWVSFPCTSCLGHQVLYFNVFLLWKNQVCLALGIPQRYVNMVHLDLQLNMSIVREIGLLTEQFTADDSSHIQEICELSLSLETVKILVDVFKW